MTVALKCPSCGAPISEAAVVAVAPVCSNCRSVITVIGGTLGLTGAYGVSDSSITRRRVEADLAVFQEYQAKYRGMKEACLQQLGWGVERYANLPQPPELLSLKEIPKLWGDGGPFLNIGLILFGLLLFGVPSVVVAWIIGLFSVFAGNIAKLVAVVIILGVIAQMVYESVSPHYKAVAANGERPQENARRQKAYEEAVAVALKIAEPLKAAEDHRLGVQIRELESCAKTVDEQEAEVRRLLAKLQ